MKRIIATIAVALLAAASLHAEGRPGFVGGFASSTMSLKDVSFNSTSGYFVGVAYNQPLLLGFELQPQLTYNVKGTEWEQIKANIGYLEAGIQAQWGIELLGLAKVYVFGEPFVGYALNGTTDYGNSLEGVALDALTGSKKVKVDMSEVGNRLEYGFGIGAGVKVIDHLQIYFKYYWDLNPTDLGDYVDTVKSNLTDLGNAKFNGLIIGAGLFF